jgi:hypothetical protein
MGPGSPTVHAFLRHLESAGFAGAPRVLGIEGDVEVLSFVPGEVPADPEWEPGKGNPLTAAMRSEAALVAAAKLLRDLHAAAAGFDPAPVDRRVPPQLLLPGEVMSHGDLGPWNTVYRDGLPVAFIDWDACAPADPLRAVAAAAWGFVPLGPEQRLVETGFDPLPNIADRLRLFIDGYGGLDRTRVLSALAQHLLGGAADVRNWQLGPTDSAVALEFIARELRWLGANSDRFERALR